MKQKIINPLEEFIKRQLEFSQAMLDYSPTNQYWLGEVTALKVVERYLQNNTLEQKG